MSGRSEVNWKGGVWGAAAGILFGLLILLFMTLLRDVSFTSTRPQSAGGTGAGREPAGAGNMLTLADGEAGIGIPDGVSTRGRAQLFLLAAHMSNDDYEKAIAVADEMNAGVDRDAGLQEISEKIVPRDLTTNPALIPKDDQAGRKELIRQLRRLIQLADRATGPDLRARLLVRTAVVKRSLDRESPATAPAEEADLDPTVLLAKVASLARAVPPDPAKAGDGMIPRILLTALLGMFGFMVGQVVQPVLQATGSIMATEVSRFVRAVDLTERLARIHKEVTGEDLTKQATDPTRE